MPTLLHDLRFSLRTLRKSPGFVLVVVLTLALGIGATTAVFSVLDAVLLRPLPFPDAERIQLVWTHSRETPESWLSHPEWLDLREQSSAFSDFAAVRDLGFSVSGGAEPEQISALAVSANLFPVLGVEPALGRSFLPEEDRLGAGRVVILNDGFWRRRFGGDPAIVGRTILLDGEPYTVVGVMPPGFRLLPPSSVFPADAAAFVSLEPALGSGVLRQRDVRHLHVFGRLRPGVTAAQAQAEIQRIADGLRQAHPEVYTAPGWGMHAAGYQEHLVRTARPALLILFGAVGFLLLLVIVNVANLLLVRHTTRTREFAVRAALGASRARLVRLELSESLVLVLLSTPAALVLASFGLDLLRSLGPAGLPRLDEVALEGRGLGVSFALAVGATLALGLVPALHTARAEVGRALQESARSTSAGVRSGRTRRTLAATQIALALVLLVSTGLLMRSLLRLIAVPTGFDAAQVTTLRLPLSGPRYSNGQERLALISEAEERLRSLPGVGRVGMVTQLPLSGAMLGSGFLPAEAMETGAAEYAPADLRGVTPGYFETMGMPLLRGRGFAETDAHDAPWVAVIDETLAARFWPGEDPIGKRLRWQRAAEPIEVVGVTAAVRHAGLAEAPRPTVYRPYSQYSPATTVFLAVRSRGDAASLAAGLRHEIRQLDPDLPITELYRMEERVRSAAAEPRFYTLLLGLFTGAALLVATLGVYSVVSFDVAQRTREIGIRTALGARSSDVLSLVVREGLRLSALGVAAGMLVAVAVARVLGSLLFEVSPGDPLVFGSTLVLLPAVTLVASYLPARRAARVDPMVALRAE